MEKERERGRHIYIYICLYIYIYIYIIFESYLMKQQCATIYPKEPKGDNMETKLSKGRQNRGHNCIIERSPCGNALNLNAKINHPPDGWLGGWAGARVGGGAG